MTTCKTSSRKVRGVIGGVAGAAVGVGLAFVLNNLGSWLGNPSLDLSFNDKPLLKNIRVFGLPLIGAASGGYIAARKPTCY
jgi:hypothetical protein